MTPCVESSNRKDSHGYGQVRVNGRKVLSHRLAWMAVHGGIPKRLCVLHHCDNRACVRVSHLFLGTHGDNMRDMKRKGRAANTKGEANGNAKLTATTAMMVYRATGTNRAISTLFQITPEMVGRIKAGKNWAHVTQA